MPHGPDSASAPDASDAERVPEAFRKQAANEWREVEPDLLDPGTSGSIPFESEVVDGEAVDDDGFDDDDDVGAEDEPTFQADTEFVPALYNPDIEGYDPALYEPPTSDYADRLPATAEPAADAEGSPEEVDFVSELVRTRGVLLRLEQTVARDLTMLAEQIEAINHRLSALEQDHDAIREWIDGTPDEGTGDLRATRAQVRALNHRITAIERASK
jgi:hypothetical protein